MRTLTIVFGVLAVLGIGATVFFVIQNNELRPEIVSLQEQNTKLEEDAALILGKARNYLLSEGRAVIPEGDISCVEETEQCLDYWTTRLRGGTAQKSSCDFTNNEVGCGRNDFKIVSPNGGEVLCIGKTYKVEWSVPSDLGTISLKARIGAGVSSKDYPIGVGEFPGSYNEEGLKNGKGVYLWKIPSLPESDVYKIWINAVYKGSSVNDSSDDFLAIRNC